MLTVNRFSVYIKQGGEVESRGGVLESSSSHVSPMTSYWRAPGLESPARVQRYSYHYSPDSIVYVKSYLY